MCKAQNEWPIVLFLIEAYASIYSKILTTEVKKHHHTHLTLKFTKLPAVLINSWPSALPRLAGACLAAPA